MDLCTLYRDGRRGEETSGKMVFWRSWKCRSSLLHSPSRFNQSAPSNTAGRKHGGGGPGGSHSQVRGCYSHLTHFKLFCFTGTTESSLSIMVFQPPCSDSSPTPPPGSPSTRWPSSLCRPTGRRSGSGRAWPWPPWQGAAEVSWGPPGTWSMSGCRMTSSFPPTRGGSELNLCHIRIINCLFVTVTSTLLMG